MTDAALVRAAQRGDPMALAQLMEKLMPFVGRICGPIALQDGQDAAQEALIAILRGIKGLKEPDALHAWARVIAVREAVKIARSRSQESQLDSDKMGTSNDPQLAADITDTLRRLSPEHRAILTLRDIEGLTEQQAAHVLAVQPGTVRSRLHRARRSFRKVWQS